MRNILVILSFLFTLSSGAQELVDSLKNELSKSNNEKLLSKLNDQIGDFYNNKSPDSSIVYFKKSLKFVKISDENKCSIFHKIGIQYDVVNKFDSANYYYDKAKFIANRYDFKLFKAKISNSQGVTAYRKGLYEKSIEYYLEGLKSADELGDTSLIVKLNDNIGHIFYYQSDFDKAEKHYSVALKYGNEKSNSAYYANANMNLGYIQLGLEDNEKAKSLFLKALNVFRESQDLYWLSNAYQNVAVACNRLNQFSESENYYLKSLEIFEKTGQKEGIAQTYVNLGEMFLNQKKYGKAEKYLVKGLEICKEIGVPEGMKYSYLGLKSVFEEQNDFEKALLYYQEFVSLKDSLVSEQSSNQIQELETKYESEKKQKEIDLLNKEKVLSQLKIEKKNQYIITVLIVLVLILILLILAFIAFNQKRKSNKLLLLKNTEIAEANEELNQQNEEILAQRDEIEQQRNHLELQNKEISDSINVAERIQKAFFKTEDDEKSVLPKHFVIFEPKDVVSGDFYWSHLVDDNNDKIIYISVVDCTGHGVPGAFMSMLGLSFINEILLKNPLISPANLLTELRTKVVSELSQNEDGDVKEGMDMALVRINMSTLEMQFSGANNPIYYTENHELIELKGTKQPIGFSYNQKDFKNHLVQLKKGEMIYLFSDGFADQFGGPKNKKIGYSKLKEILKVNKNQNIDFQKENLHSFLKIWKGDEEQIDDICLIGMKV